MREGGKLWEMTPDVPNVSYVSMKKSLADRTNKQTNKKNNLNFTTACRQIIKLVIIKKQTENWCIKHMCK